jgi:CheY-like chemotaxis protein
MEAKPPLILLVEDNPDHAELVRRCFQGHRATLLHLRDGEDALDYLFRRGRYARPGAGPPPQLVLLDLRLPRVDGLEVLRQLKAAPELQGLRVVILTSSQSDADVARAQGLRANGYLVKPLDPAQAVRLLQDTAPSVPARNVTPP